MYLGVVCEITFLERGFVFNLECRTALRDADYPGFRSEGCGQVRWTLLKSPSDRMTLSFGAVKKGRNMV